MRPFAALPLASLLPFVACAAEPPPPAPAPLALASSAPAPSSPPSSSSSAAPAPEQAPAARRFAEWFDAFNSGDPAKLRAFWAPNVDAARVDGMVQGDIGLHDETGGFDLKKTQESTATHFLGILQERASDHFASIEIEADPAEPHRIVNIRLKGIAPPDDLAPARMTEADALKAMQDKVDAAVAADRFSGAVLVAKNGTVVFARAYGLADRDKKLPNELSTRFRIGSMNKMFTATAVLQLVQSKKIALTDTVGKLLPDYPNKNVASKVTVQHLLSHTGGTGDIFGPEFDAHRLTVRTLRDYVKLYGNRDLAFEPGSRWAYGNYGFLLLGVIIERVTGRSYYDWVAAHVFKPAGMTSTASLPEDQVVAGRSVGYTRPDAGSSWRSDTDTLPYRGTSAGGGYSTVEDLLRFASALRDHKLLDAAHTTLLTTARTDMDYALGFSDATSSGVRCYGHNGGAPGMNGDLAICDSGYTVAVLSNLDPPAAGRVSDFVKLRLPAQ